ncbi:MAG: hypothetical protein J2P44_04200 [Candidatus Dormibacteraeota bacterium]|nr:hypothetical protein [Candidatus Dormibacteraeota bacterium]
MDQLVASSGLAVFWGVSCTSDSHTIDNIWPIVLVVWEAGSSVSASVPMATVKVPPCPEPDWDEAPPQAAIRNAAMMHRAQIRCLTATTPPRNPSDRWWV